MKITGTDAGFAPNAMKMPDSEDSLSKSIQGRIDALQKELQSLSENDDIDPKEKLKRKEEINRQISELNEQLNRRRQDKEQEKQEAAKTPDDKRFDRFERGGSMNGIISADISVGQAQTRGSAARSLEGKVNVLKSEIRQDGARGASTEDKQRQVAELSAKARSAVSAQNDELGKASEKLKKAEEEADAEKEENKENDGKAQEKEQI